MNKEQLRETIDANFSLLFNAHMKGGSLLGFRKRFVTLFSKVIIPLAEQMYWVGYRQGSEQLEKGKTEREELLKAEPRQLRIGRTPYILDIINTLNADELIDVVVKKGAALDYSTINDSIFKYAIKKNESREKVKLIVNQVDFEDFSVKTLANGEVVIQCKLTKNTPTVI